MSGPGPVPASDGGERRTAVPGTAGEGATRDNCDVLLETALGGESSSSTRFAPSFAPGCPTRATTLRAIK